jgi:hypothetical protein
MFNNNTDFQIHNSTLYNVAGDINLQTHHHLTIQDYHAAFQPPAGSMRGLEDGRDGSHPHLTIHDHEPHEAGFSHRPAQRWGWRKGSLKDHSASGRELPGTRIMAWLPGQHHTVRLKFFWIIFLLLILSRCCLSSSSFQSFL